MSSPLCISIPSFAIMSDTLMIFFWSGRQTLILSKTHLTGPVSKHVSIYSETFTGTLTNMRDASPFWILLFSGTPQVYCRQKYMKRHSTFTYTYCPIQATLQVYLDSLSMDSHVENLCFLCKTTREMFIYVDVSKD